MTSNEAKDKLKVGMKVRVKLITFPEETKRDGIVTATTKKFFEIFDGDKYLRFYFNHYETVEFLDNIERGEYQVKHNMELLELLVENQMFRTKLLKLEIEKISDRIVGYNININ